MDSAAHLYLYPGAVIALAVLGIISIKLTSSGYISGRPDLGWALFGIAAAILFTTIALMSRGDTIDFGTIGTLFEIVFLCFLFGLQTPLALELLALTIVPVPGKGLKLLKVHSAAERKVIEDDIPGAIAEYERIVADDPKDFPAQYRLAELFCENKEYEKAAKAYRRFVSRGSELGVDQRCTALTRLSEIYAQNLGDKESARKCMQVILKEYPNTKYAGHAAARLENLQDFQQD